MSHQELTGRGRLCVSRCFSLRFCVNIFSLALNILKLFQFEVLLSTKTT